MNKPSFDDVKIAVQVVSVSLSVFINTFLIFLITTASSKKMGNYRHLMVFFCICSIFFSVMDIIVRPVIHSHESAFFMMMDLRHRNMSLQLAICLICGMTGCFGIIIYGIAIHFIYRYYALERRGKTKYFDKKLLPLWFSIPLLGGMCWTLVSFFLFPMSQSTSEYLKPAIESMGMDVNQVAYAAAIFWPREHEFNWNCGLGLFLYLVIMSIPFIVVMTVAVKSAEKIQDFPVSKYGKDLQMQLYKALMAQTIIPVLLLFLPFGVLFLCPILKINCKFLATSLTFVYALYPVVDPLPIFFFVESYRLTIFRMISLSCGKSRKIHAFANEEVSREANSI